jgi:cytoskeletal protein RodZ
MPIRSKHNTSRKILLIGAILLLVIGAGVFTMGQSRHWWNTSSKTATNDSGDYKVKTRTATSEGKQFDVPQDLPKDSIKNYDLVTENEEYKIRRLAGTNEYTITLYAIINRPDQYSTYKDQLREYKQNALDYLKKTGVDINRIKITYEPSETTDL